MKNTNLFLIAAALFAMISCGTANRSTYYGNTQFRNSIYYNPDNLNTQEYAQEQQNLQQLQEKTVGETSGLHQQETYNASTNTKTIYMGSSNEVDVSYDPGVTYSIVDSRESYESRLRKFDSPNYTINIEFNDPYPWWRHAYGWYHPIRTGWYGSYHSWHNPYWGWHYSWGWYDPFYDPFFDPWWGHTHWYGYWPGYWPSHRPVWHPGHYPGWHPGHNPKPHYGRDIYYGKRNSSPTYRNSNSYTPMDRGMHNTSSRPASGSITRREPATTQINRENSNPTNTGISGNNGRRPQNAGAQQSGNGQYRRVAPEQQTKNTGTVKNGNSSNNSRNSSYNRNSGSQTRSNSGTYNRSTQTRSSSYSSGSSYSNGSRSSGTTRSSGNSSGSSYRRR